MDTQKTPLGVLNEAPQKQMKAAGNSRGGNKENPGQSPLRQKGSNKK